MAGLTPIFDVELKERFLELLASGTVTIADAARAVGVSPQTVTRHRATDPDFAAAWEDMIERRTDLLETEARRRALAKSDPLLMFMLKAARPDTYAERSKTETKLGALDGENLTETEVISRMVSLLNAKPEEPAPPAEGDASRFV